MESYALENELKQIKQELRDVRGQLYGLATLLAAIGVELDDAVRLAREKLSLQNTEHSEGGVRILEALRQMRAEMQPVSQRKRLGGRRVGGEA